MIEFARTEIELCAGRAWLTHTHTAGHQERPSRDLWCRLEADVRSVRILLKLGGRNPPIGQPRLRVATAPICAGDARDREARDRWIGHDPRLREWIAASCERGNDRAHEAALPGANGVHRWATRWTPTTYSGIPAQRIPW
jgi:hypothetical protein